MEYRTFLHCENGARIPAVFAEKSVDEIVSLELENIFSFVSESKVKTESKVRCIEFLDKNISARWNNNYVTLNRVFSLSDSCMARYQLYHRIRVEFTIHCPTGAQMKHSCAYTPGMFG